MHMLRRRQAQRVTVYYRPDLHRNARTVRMEGRHHGEIGDMITHLSEHPDVAEIVSVWEDDGRMTITRDGFRVRRSKHAPAGEPGGAGDTGLPPEKSRPARLARIAERDAADGYAPALSPAMSPALGEALTRFTSCFTDALCIGTIAEQLGCEEVNAVAALLRLDGQNDAADQWISQHTSRDCPNGAHDAESATEAADTGRA